ncbi:arylsulfatase [Polaribacter sp. AHE13PA]|uniref:arylsulfatase n=1 Tax=Polaribacter sp. AHE13PA TaxID=2745562 RepID=UPI001C4EE937|nr:arylsulfatase [Polaribacter sp. AHE13PA]QXP66370.1 arylsulfatase [Polaribacter sp. AHE13PA]
MKNSYASFKIIMLLVVIFFSCDKKEQQQSKPNIILIYADDLGIGMLGHEGQKIITTPNIDQLANEGMRFKNSYSSMLCAPSRASLITGKTDTHATSFEISKAGIYKKARQEGFSPEEIEAKINKILTPIPKEDLFLGEVAQKAGYVTAQYGKLEWGFAATHQQMNRHGWDHYFGYLDHARAHGFYPPYLFGNDGLVKIEGNTLINCAKSIEPETPEAYKERWDMTGKKTYSQDIFMDSVTTFIRKNKDKPFFLYFPTQLPHGPVSIPKVHDDFINDSRLTQIEKEYASMVKLLDDNVGEIMNELKSSGIDDNTIVIFSADNGHEIYYAKEGRIDKKYTNRYTKQRFNDYDRKYYSELAGDVFDGNGGRAGLKRSNLQGGINVPLIVRWPQKIAPKTVSKRLVAGYDILPTVAEIAGFSEELKVDGISFYDELLGRKKKVEHDYVVFSSFIGPTLITNDGWKIRYYNHKKAFNLYYLPTDFKEENDLSREHPEKYNTLKKLLLKACDGDYNNGFFKWSKIMNIKK